MENNLQGDRKPVVLVIEDDVFLSNVHQDKLSKEGFEVMMATNGEEGLVLAKKTKPDIIILDIIMPVKDGFETLKELRSDPNLKDVRVIILTNLSREEDKQRVMELGATEYIVKADVSFREIVDVIKRYLT